MKIHQKVFAVVFMTALLVFSVGNIVVNFKHIKGAILDLERPNKISDTKKYTASIDSLFTENLPFDHGWNEAYAMVYNFLGKNEENSFAYVRDKNGMLYAANFWNTPLATSKDYINRILTMKSKVEDKNTKVVVLLYPTQYNEAWSDGYYGIPYADYNFLSDQLVAYFRYYGIDYIDYRDMFIEQGKTAEEIFYKTDHHWKIESAFDAFVELTNYLNDKYDEKLDPFYTDKSNYEYITYEKYYIGSQGRDAGVSYVGADDFTYVLPKFDNSYTCHFVDKVDEEIYLTGSMIETMINTDAVEKEDYYDRELYASYLNGIRLYDNIVNNNNPDGLNVLFLRDSFSSPLATFFSSYCNSMELYWTVRNDAETMEAAVENGEYDYIFIGLAVDSIATDGFDIYMEEDADE